MSSLELADAVPTVDLAAPREYIEALPTAAPAKVGRATEVRRQAAKELHLV